ncbi:hypothetical protein EUGRSUZ_E02553 [Eucalyptus grandis]|uniref:Uncharacterized protein n=2 Tax=Eucalyptus grandis TaxID=71139 RepID=A0ACC3KXV4_EUCGR|nr:hypothetical protein EUGRSUZ_E02553 [Eucalyptus grandis]
MMTTDPGESEKRGCSEFLSFKDERPSPMNNDSRSKCEIILETSKVATIDKVHSGLVAELTQFILDN